MTKMTTMRIVALACLCGLGALIPKVSASEFDKKTIFTFSAPVEVPGEVSTPGTYVFKLLDSPSNRNIVQVFNKDENHLIGTFLTIPDYRMKPPDKPLVTFEERAAGAPEAIKAWYYPGDNYGNEFVYPKVRAAELAKQNQQNVPSMPGELAQNTTSATEDQNSKEVKEMKETKLQAQKPSGEEVEVADVFLIVAPAVPVAAPAPVAVLASTSSADRDAPAQLPQTASSLPRLALIGVFLLAVGLGLQARVRRAR